MCGIYGGYWPGVKEAPESQLSKAKRLLQHRGPDDCGLDSFCIWRDTSIGTYTTFYYRPINQWASADASKDGRYSIVFNGEIL